MQYLRCIFPLQCLEPNCIEVICYLDLYLTVLCFTLLDPVGQSGKELQTDVDIMVCR